MRAQQLPRAESRRSIGGYGSAARELPTLSIQEMEQEGKTTSQVLDSLWTRLKWRTHGKSPFQRPVRDAYGA